MMDMAWVLSSQSRFPSDIGIDNVKQIGPIWSSWRSWRDNHSDNVVCDDVGQARVLLQRAFQAVCNFYLPRRLYQDLARPQGVRWYDGEFQLDTASIEDVIAMHLASSQNDVILLYGFDFSIMNSTGDAVQDHRIRNQRGLYRQIISDATNTQWVVIDHDKAFDPAFAGLANLMQDTMAGVIGTNPV